MLKIFLSNFHLFVETVSKDEGKMFNKPYYQGKRFSAWHVVRFEERDFTFPSINIWEFYRWRAVGQKVLREKKILWQLTSLRPHPIVIDLPQNTMTNIFIGHSCFGNSKYHQQLPKNWGFDQTGWNRFVDWHQRGQWLARCLFSLCQFIPLPLRSNYGLPVHISHMVTHFSRRGPRGRGRGKISRDSIELYSDYLFKCCQSGAINLWFSIIRWYANTYLNKIKQKQNQVYCAWF